MGDGGCGGGNAVNAWAYANNTGGIEPASFYEYTSGTTKQTGICQTAKVKDDNRMVSACQSFWIAQGASDEDNMISDIPLTPLSVAVAADYWQTYVSGVVTADDGCGPSQKYPIDHNVQVTGFNADDNYYIVRNSWGTGLMCAEEYIRSLGDPLGNVLVMRTQFVFLLICTC